MIIGLYFVVLLQTIVIVAKFIYDRRKDKRIESFLNYELGSFEESRKKIDKNFNEVENENTTVRKELKEIKTLINKPIYEKIDEVNFLVKIFGSNYSAQMAQKTIEEIKKMIEEDL